MEKLYWLILISPMVIGKESYPVGKEMQFKADDYLELIARGTAKPKDQKEYEKLKLEKEEAKQAKEELKAKAIASLEQEKLKESAKELKKELESTLELIDDEEFIKTLMPRDINIELDAELEKKFSDIEDEFRAKAEEATRNLKELEEKIKNREEEYAKLYSDIQTLTLKELRAKYQ